MNIPFLDYRRSFGRYRDFVGNLVAEAAASGDFILKQKVRWLESAICALTGAAHAVATASATGGMTLALRAFGVGPGTRVLLPAFGFPSPVSCVLNLGGEPVFVDVESEGGVMDAGLLEAVDGARAVLPMHLGRAVADMRAVTEFARARGLWVLEDSAVALGARIDGVPAGRWGDAGVFSFFPSKPLGGIGDAGMLITEDEELAQRCRRLRNHGQVEGRRFVYEEIGWNCRMDEIAAGFLLMKLHSFGDSIRRREEIADYYDRSFARLGERLTPLAGARADRCHHAYVVAAEARDELRRHLEGVGVGSQLFHPTPLHLHPAFRRLGYREGDFPVAEWLGRRTLSLPFYPELTDAEVEYVAGKVLEFYER